ncbi:hypothetical protein CHUAL_007837 [Chamberlinius hualienensis]
MEHFGLKLKKWIPTGQLLVLKILLFLYFGATQSLVPYLVVHMQQIGISVNQTAIIHAMLPIAMFIGPPISGFLADRSGGFRILLFVCLILTGVLHTCLLWVPAVAPANQLDKVVMNCDSLNHTVELKFEQPLQSNCLQTESVQINFSNCQTHCPLPYEYEVEPSSTSDQPSSINSLCVDSSLSSVCIAPLNNKSYMALPFTQTSINDTLRKFRVVNVFNSTSECGSLLPDNCSITCDIPYNFNSLQSASCGDEMTTFSVYLVIRVLAAIFMSSCFVLLDAITLILIKDGGTDYGKQRVWPVIATAVFPPITGALVDGLSPSIDKPNYAPTFYVHDILLLLTAALSPLLSLKVTFSHETNLKAVCKLVKTPRADALIISLFVLGTMWGFVEVFLYLYLLELGSPKYLLGLTLTVGSAVGIPVLFYSEILINKFGHVNIMFVAFIFYAIRYVGYTFIYNPWWCLIFEAMEIFTLHLLWVAVVKYSSRLAPKGLQATMQGAIGGTHYGVGRGSGSLIGGLLTGYLGYRLTFLYMGIAAAVAGVIYLIIEKTVFRKPLPPLNKENEKEVTKDVCNNAQKDDNNESFKSSKNKNSVPTISEQCQDITGWKRLIWTQLCIINDGFYSCSCRYFSFTRGLHFWATSNIDDNVKVNHDSSSFEDTVSIKKDGKVNIIRKRSVVQDKSGLWTFGVVPYYIDEAFFEDYELVRIKEAFKEFHQKTCIRFIPRTTEMPYLLITPLTKCWSEIGMPSTDSIRSLSLGPQCLEKTGTIIHELMHILGFWHEQNRPDRDNYITIMWNNIMEDNRHNFYKYSSDKIDTLNEPYDYQSIMHYSAHAYAKDPNQPTIVPRINVEIGQRLQLSILDVKKIKKLYRCHLHAFVWPWSRATTLLPVDKRVKEPESPIKSQSEINGKPGDIIYPSSSSDHNHGIPVFLDWITRTTPDSQRILFPDDKLS